VKQIIHLTGNTHRGSARLKHVLTALISGGTPDTNNDDYWSDDDEGIAWVVIGDMSTTALVRFTEKKVTESGLASKRLQVMPPGTLIYSMYASMGHVAELAIPATINQALLGFEFVEDVEPSFAKWWLRHLQPVLLAEASSNTQDNLNADKVKNLPFPAIDLASQVCIASFLDRETAGIDRLIAEKERMLALLDEKRSALISRVVTRGLDANAPLKSSGLEWLGKIPAHWGEPRAKGLFREVDIRTDTGEEKLLSLRMGKGLVPHEEVSDKDLEPSDVIGFKKIEPDQMVINRMRAASGLIAVATESGLVSPDYSVFEVADHELSIEYFLELFKTTLLQAVFRSSSKGLGTGEQGFLRLYTDSFLSIHFPYPPVHEQNAIAAFIQKERTEMLQMESLLIRSIELAKERRAALITAAVTGQIAMEEMK
jgi:type I restriction enzyme S subunit